LTRYVGGLHSRLDLTKSFLQEFSRQVSTAEGEQFAKRMDSLFIEASAKTNLGVNEAFQEVVEQILETPELWDGVAGRSGGGGHGTGGGGGGMPGGVQVIGLSDSQEQGQGQGGGCAC
jgi:Ras-related protein Rab-18